MTSAGVQRASCGSMQIAVHPDARLVAIRFVSDTHLAGEHGAALVDALERVAGADRFALLADCEHVCDTDTGYRRATGAFFGRHRETARIALFNLSPIIRVVAEMFRIGIGLQLRTFADDTAARSWLRTQGIRP
jgi:hypothetical protein